MLSPLWVPVVALYFLVVGALFVYGINCFYLTYVAWRKRDAHSPPPPVAAFAWPRVTVQLPIYNELFVAERLIHTMAQLDYPRALLEIQVLDDSTDETVDVVRGAVERLRAQGLDIAHLRRAHRRGFKAGALAEGMARARGEFIAIFDADFIPPSDFLKRTLPHFQDRRLAFVQARWEHVNRRDSLLTALQSLALDAHFAVEQFARCYGGYCFNFNGTAGVWRRAALEDAGGWAADTLAEDLDLSYRVFLRGWRGLYLRDVEVPGELPASFTAYRRQQQRWARGYMECARKLLPEVWRAPLPFLQKIMATLHLTCYNVHLLLCLLTVLYPAMLYAFLRVPGLEASLAAFALFNLTTFAPLAFFVTAQRQLGRRWWQMSPLILCMLAFGAGMMLNTARAALSVVGGRRGEFERTPKFGLQRGRRARGRDRYHMRFDPIVFWELAFALFNFGTAASALWMGNWVIAVYAALFGAGLLFTSGLTLAQTLAARRAPSPVAPVPAQTLAGD
jgi:cellulose synthase/poly-beta-1,6-N-acetylglucosamine synthase-like glycosyltransferase